MNWTEVCENRQIQDLPFKKVEPYLARGAKEVWVYQETGNIRLYSYQGEISASSFFDQIPVVDIG